MEGFGNDENQESVINLLDFPFMCRICLKLSKSRLFKMEDYLMELYQTITKINVRSTANLPKNICNDCIKTLEDISSFIDIFKNNDVKSRKNFIPKSENEHVETAEYGASRNLVIKSEETIEYEDDSQYFKGFENCRICYSTNILKPVEGKAHLMQIFRNITNIVVEAEVTFSNRNSICNKCINELETISLFIGVSVSNEIKLENKIGRYEALEIENCSEESAFGIGHRKEVKKNDEFDGNTHSYDSKSLHTSTDIKEEILDIPEDSIGPSNRNIMNIFSASISEDNPFDLDLCKDEFSTGTHLKNPLKGLADKIQPGKDRFKFDAKEKPFKCSYCEKCFTQKGSLQQHMTIHTGKKSFKCDFCEKSFNFKRSLKTHLLIHTGKKSFKCSYCEKGFIQKGNLQRHMLTHIGEKPSKCDYCAQSFTSRSVLQQHLLIHSGEKPFKCGCCKKSFNRKVNLQQHMITHTEEKPFKCGCCKKSFNRKANLQQHMIIHTGEKPFKCGCCQKSFTKKDNLQRHMITHIEEEPVKCRCCEKRFIQKDHLQRHMLTHTVEKPYKCDSCSKSFTSRSNLQQHVLIHSGEKQFNCGYCKKTFDRQICLQTHLLSPSQCDRPFKCDSCENSFTLESHWKQHNMLIHSGEKPSLPKVSHRD